MPLPLNEFDKLLKELDNDIKKFFNSGKKTAETINKIYDVGKRQGMPKELIRNKIELVVTGRIKSRQLRKLLPADLKRVYTKSIIPELTDNPVILVDGKLEDPDNTILPPILDKKSLEQREKLPKVIACRRVIDDYKRITQNMMDYIIDKDDPLREELVQAANHVVGYLNNPNDKKYKKINEMKLYENFYKSDEYKRLNTSLRLVNPDGTPVFKEITKEQAPLLASLITTQFEYTVTNDPIFGKWYMALTKVHEKYVQPWIEKRAMNVKKKRKGSNNT